MWEWKTLEDDPLLEVPGWEWTFENGEAVLIIILSVGEPFYSYYSTSVFLSLLLL